MTRTASLTLPRRFGAPRRAGGLAARLAFWRSLARERSDLARLDARALRDIGVDPAAAAVESGRPFWDEPEGRRA